MIQCPKTAAAAYGARVHYVQLDDGDEPAIELYSKLGMRKDMLHFDLAPSKGGG
jgi:aminoglycoside 3-N-acetyltransferase I